MADHTDFDALISRAMALPGRVHMRPVIEKELLHYDILFSLDREGLLDQLTFQGGTALRLCHGSPRFSEDLDFAGGPEFSGDRLRELKACIEAYLGPRYGMAVRTREPADLRNEPENVGVHVSKWQIAVVTAPQRKDVPQQRIKIEVANVPAWTREPRPLLVNYDFLPDGYADTLVMTETLHEVMADKLVSLVNTEKYVRHRDIWDLRWLKQQGARVDVDLVSRKIHDYSIENYSGKLRATWERLPEIVRGEPFRQEMSRFLPMDVQERTLAKDKFYDFLADEVSGLLQIVSAGLRSEPPEFG